MENGLYSAPCEPLGSWGTVHSWELLFPWDLGKQESWGDLAHVVWEAIFCPQMPALPANGYLEAVMIGKCYLQTFQAC